MLAQKSNLTIGNQDKQRSLTGVKNLRTKISKLLRTCYSDNNNMMLAQGDMVKKFPNSSWTSTD